MLRKDKFDEREADFYEALYTQSQAQFDSYVQTSTVLNNYAHVFSLLVRLRQVNCLSLLQMHSQYRILGTECNLERLVYEFVSTSDFTKYLSCFMSP